MNNMPDTSSMTLESIALRKKELRKKLHAQKEIMTDTARELFAPITDTFQATSRHLLPEQLSLPVQLQAATPFHLHGQQFHSDCRL